MRQALIVLFALLLLCCPPIGQVLSGQPATRSPVTSMPTSGPSTYPTTASSTAAPAEMIRKFWTAFAGADLEEAGKHYAQNVTLKPFCHLMKKEFGVVDRDGVNADLTVPREKVLAGYGRMMATLGKDKWVKALGGIAAGKIAIDPVEKDGDPFAKARRGDWVLRVAPVQGEGLVFLFRAASNGRMLVVSEKFDY